jgi:membrane fusion protein, multidrug efflux system
MTKKRNWRIAGIIAALMLSAVFFLLLIRGKTTVGEAAVSAPDVEVVSVEQKDLPVYREWIGTLDGLVNAAIRSQVTGYLLTQNYSEGSFIKKGQLLFEIDPRPLQAAVDQAKGQLAQANGQLAQAQAQYQQSEAQLASAEANQHKAQFDENRYTPLARQHAVTQQDLDNAVQNNISAQAQVKVAAAQVEAAKAQIQGASAAVEAAKATLEAANVNLGFTKLYSPIDGVAGNAQIQIGNLVSPATSAVTTVSTVDPIKVTFAISEQE